MANGKEGSSSNPRPIEVVPRRGRGRALQGRVNRPGELIPPLQTPPVMGVPGQSAFTPYARPPQQSMGVPGQSAFSPYARPAQPGSNEGVGLEGGVGFQGAQAVPVGGSGSGDVAAPGALRIGGSPGARKRTAEGGAASGDQPPDNQVRCTVCGKVFRTPKALFGHMRAHPDRGWKGAHPPPAFRAEEEFANLREEAEAEGVEAMEEEEAEDYRLPDLNKQPPPHDSN